MSARSRHGGGGESVQDLLAEAKSFVEAGKYGKAASTLKKILARDPEHWEALRLSATLNLKLGSLFAARSAFESLARKAIASGDSLVAQSLLKEYLAVVPRYIPFLEMLGQVFETTGNSTGAIVEYGKALSFIQDNEDPEHKGRGVAIYRRVKALDPNGPIVKQLSAVYEAEAAALEEAERQRPPASASSSSPGSAPSPPVTGTDDPWMGQGEPAPFPWEVPDSPPPAAPAPAAEVAPPPPPVTPPPEPTVAHEPAPPPPVEPEPPPASEAPATPSGAFRFASAPEPPPAPEPEPVSEPPAAVSAPEPEAEPTPAEPPAGVFAAETPSSPGWEDRSSDRTATVDEGWSRDGDVSPTPVEEARPAEPPPAMEAPAPEPAPSQSFGLRLSPDQQQEEPARASQALAREESAAPVQEESDVPARAWFRDDSGGARAEADQALAPPFGQEESQAAPEPTTRRRGRRKGGEPAAPTAPMWAAPPAPGESQTPSTSDLFPTATKLKFKLTIFSRRALSAVRSITVLTVSLATGCGVLAVLAVVGLSLVWIGTEEKPSNAFYSLMKVPTPPLLDRRQNGYLKLMAIGASSDRAPVRMGERRSLASADPAPWPEGFADLAEALSGWYGTWDPVEQFDRQRGVIRQWSAFFGSQMARYNKWVASPIEDVGYASLEAPDEGMVLGMHRLYVAEGFSDGMTRGVGRLQRDLETWRHALAEAKTLRFKILALEALNDDLVVMSGLLARPDLDLTLLPAMAKMSRPMEHAERSLRWPMQNQFVLEMEMAKTFLRVRGDTDPRPDYLKALTFFPLPKQKIFNAHATYYEALVKHDSVLKVEGDPRKQMPQRYDLTSAPPRTFSDYIANPVDNLLVQEDRVDWNDIIGRILETEARLRLGSLQARIRRPPPTKDPLTRIANAGQDYYDPFTGFTMLLNGNKTILYSVGRNGRDDDGDLTTDVSVPLTPQDS